MTFFIHCACVKKCCRNSDPHERVSAAAAVSEAYALRASHGSYTWITDDADTCLVIFNKDGRYTLQEYAEGTPAYEAVLQAIETPKTATTLPDELAWELYGEALETDA